MILLRGINTGQTSRAFENDINGMHIYVVKMCDISHDQKW